MIFELEFTNRHTLEKHSMLYDNINSTLKYPDGRDVLTRKITELIPPDKIKKRLYISLGFSCNFSCNYCLQKNTSKQKATEVEIQKIADQINSEDVSGKWVGFWGGEPLLYFKEMTEIISRVTHKDIQYSIVTNGSLMTRDKAEYLVEKGFIIILSHDCHAQNIERGPDPLDKHNEVFKWLLNYPKFTISSTLSPSNISTAERLDHIESKLGTRDVAHGGSGIVYNYKNIGTTTEEYRTFANKVYEDLVYGEGFKYGYYNKYILYFLNSIKNNKHISEIATKCDIEKEDTYKVLSLKGQTISCHNFAGDLKRFTLHSPEKRELCYRCPIVQICKGSCPLVDPHTEQFKINCESKYHFYLSLLKVALEMSFDYEYILTQINPKEDLDV